MKIALDYDKTYTEDPDFWRAFIILCQMHGHDCRIVTVRDDRPGLDRTQPLIDLEGVLPVIYTRGVAKRWYCDQFTDGWRPDIWVDDNPDNILTNSRLTPEQLVEWRATRAH